MFVTIESRFMQLLLFIFNFSLKSKFHRLNNEFNHIVYYICFYLAKVHIDQIFNFCKLLFPKI